LKTSLLVTGVTSEHCTNEFSNYRILTPRLHALHVLHGELSSRFQLPVFDASKEGFRIQDSVVRISENSRRQESAVGFSGATEKLETSKPGSWRPEAFGASAVVCANLKRFNGLHEPGQI
jgi:hypothetical protein